MRSFNTTMALAIAALGLGALSANGQTAPRAREDVKAEAKTFRPKSEFDGASAGPTLGSPAPTGPAQSRAAVKSGIGGSTPESRDGAQTEGSRPQKLVKSGTSNRAHVKAEARASSREPSREVLEGGAATTVAQPR